MSTESAVTKMSPGAAGASSHAAPRPPALVELCSELFSLAYSLRLPQQDLGDPNEVRRRILQFLDRLDTEGRNSGYGTHLLESARFALVALIDETVQSSQWRGKESWRANPLQRELFKINLAGEEFYTRLEQLRANAEENRSVLEVYYACLIMGFEGRFKLLGREKLESLIHSLAAEISHGQTWRMENLSPSWRRPDEFHEIVGEGVPVWLTIAVLLGSALILIVIFRLIASGDAKHAADLIERFVQNIKL